MVLDGDESFRTGLASNLRDDGHEVLDYPSPVRIDSNQTGFGALIAAIRQGPDDCLEFVREFRRVWRDAAIVILATNWSAGLEAAAKLGSVVSKPADYDTIHRLVHGPAGEGD